jgi:hypothetical protein
LRTWVWAHPPWSLRTYSDRALALTLQPPEHRDERDLARLVRGAPKLLEACRRAGAAGRLHLDMASALVAAWALSRHGVDVTALMSLLRGHLPNVATTAQAWPEPQRSVLFYWAERLGLHDPVPPGPSPEHPMLSLYHDLHLALYRTAYGERSIPRAQCEPPASSIRAALASEHARRDPDAAAEALMVELSLTPRDDAYVEQLTRRILRAQRSDGGFADPADPDPPAAHHTACVALVTLSRQLA